MGTRGRSGARSRWTQVRQGFWWTVWGAVFAGAVVVVVLSLIEAAIR